MVKHYMEVRYENEVGKSYFYEKEVEVCGIHDNPIPDGCSGVRFFDCDVIVINGHDLRSARFNETGWTYIGEKMTIDDAKENKKISLEQYIKFSSSGHHTVVITEKGKAIPLWAVDNVVERRYTAA